MSATLEPEGESSTPSTPRRRIKHNKTSREYACESSDDTQSSKKSVLGFSTRLSRFTFESPSPSPLQTPRTAKRRRAVDSDDEPAPSEREDDVLPVLPSSSLGPNPRGKARKKPRRPYAPPEVYEHLHMLPDYLDEDLDSELIFTHKYGSTLITMLPVVFCGIKYVPGIVSFAASPPDNSAFSPGCTSANTGHHYAHATNHFWQCLHESGKDSVRCAKFQTDASQASRNAFCHHQTIGLCHRSIITDWWV